MTDDCMMHILMLSFYNNQRRADDNSPRDLPDMTTRIGSGQAIFTTIPACKRSHKDELLRDGTTEAMLDSATKRKLYAQPGFPRPLTQPPSLAQRISPAGKKGLGMFATRALSAGGLILSERPLVVHPLGAPLYTGDQMGLFRLPQSITGRVIETEFEIEVMVQRMVTKNRDAFISLTNSRDFSSCGNLVGRAYTNGLDVLQEFTFAGLPDDSGAYKGVFDKLSRVNHSCTPNAVFSWDSLSFSGSLRAIRAIQPDEEITITYCDPSLSTAERAAVLAPYDIVCDCPACKDGAASDARRNDIFAKFDQVEELESNDAKRETLLSVIKLIEEEGAEVLPEYYEAHAMLLEIYQEEKAAEETDAEEADAEETDAEETEGAKEEQGTEEAKEEKEENDTTAHEKEGNSEETKSELEEKKSEKKDIEPEQPEEEKEVVEEGEPQEKGGELREKEGALKEKENELDEKRERENEEEEEERKVEEKESEPEEKVKELEQKVNALSLAMFGRPFLPE
ncbi:SET domain-containing protein [Schizophyllum commune Tattone D]|nr:SET domain-containing protein [Schizophyllum commune Tattone D]